MKEIFLKNLRSIFLIIILLYVLIFKLNILIMIENIGELITFSD